MSLPIVFIHQGWDQYLEIALLQARRFNPDSPLYLLGDREVRPPVRVPGLTLIQNEELFQSATDFRSIYRHLSGHSPEFERFCLQRWFMLSAFLEAYDVPRCFVLDSDILLFTDVSRDAGRFSGFDLTHLWEDGPLNGFVNSPARLAEFCRYITRFYTQDFDHWAAWFTEFRAQGRIGGVTDMMVFQEFRRGFADGAQHFADLSAIRDGTAYDHNIGAPDGFQMKTRRKQIRWQNGLPHAFHLETARWIRFHSLHFQGPTKPLMRGALHGSRAQWLRGAAQIERHYFMTRLKNKLSRLRPKKPAN